jgi:hypothetical protein
LEWLESAKAHDLILDPLCKERKESRPAFILMIKKHHVFARYDHENIKLHIGFDLVWLLKTGLNGKTCSFCTGAL